MSNILEFVLKMKDQMSGIMNGACSKVVGRFKQMQDNAERFNKSVQKIKPSITQLDDALNSLKNKRNSLQITSHEDVMRLRVLNSEIKKLQASINRRETINGSRFSTWAGDAFTQMPGHGFITNPLVMAGAAASYAVKQASDREMQLVKFSTLLGNDKKGADVFGSLKHFSDVTPYRRDDILGAGETLLNYGVNDRKLMTFVKQLGDISGGSAERLNSLSLAFGQVYAKGRLAGQEVLQMVNAGFNPLQEISRTTGRSVMELTSAMEKGEITVAMVERAFSTATGSGGRFHGMMDKLGQTFQGKLSTFMDTMANMASNIGQILLPAVNKGLMVLNGTISFFVKNIGMTATVLAPFVTALLLANARAVGMAIGFRVAGIASWFMGTNIAKAGTMISAAFSTNPVLMWIAAIGAALMVAYQFFKTTKKETETIYSAYDKMASKAQLMNRVNNAEKGQYAERIAHAQQLLRYIQDENIANHLRLEKLRELKSLGKEFAGITLENAVNTDKAAKAMDAFSSSMLKNLQMAAAADFIKDLYKQYGDNVIANMQKAEQWGKIPVRVNRGTAGVIYRPRTDEEIENYQAQGNKRLAETLSKGLRNVKKAFGDIPFTLANANEPSGTGSTSTSTSTTDTASAVASGGPRVININGVKFMDTLQLHAANFKEGTDEIQRALEEMFIRILNSGAAVQ